jgi:hypothetical protein
MSASRDRRARKIRAGGILATIPDGAIVRTTFEMNGERWAELTDGRIARVQKPRIEWRIVDGRVVRS